MNVLIRVIIAAVALWAATGIDGIEVTASTTAGKAGTLVAVAAIFGVVNALLKPIIYVLGCAFYVLTLGLFALLVNAGLLMLTGWVAGEFDLPFRVEWFWPAFWGAIVMGLVSWLLNLFVADREREFERRRRRRDRRARERDRTSPAW